MGSRSQKIYLSFWFSLFFITGVAVLWLPRFLEGSGGTSVKELEAAPKANFTEEDLARVVTRFPTRAFLDRPARAPEPQPVETGNNGEGEQPVAATGPGGLPTRFVPGVERGGGNVVGERVTTRAYLRANSSVFDRPQTTATVLGRVGAQTKVRWLDKAGEGWEEILLKDGRSAYVQSDALSFSADSDSQSNSFTNRHSSQDGPNLSTLPSTVDSFLSHLSASDLLRAETFLSPLAPGLNDSTLGALSPYVGAAPEGRLLRVELVSGNRGSHRKARIVYGAEMAYEVLTLWEWDHAQQRWMLVRWD